MEAAAVRFRIKGTKVYIPPVTAAPHRAKAAAAYESASVAPRLANWLVNSGGPNSTLGGSLSTLRSRSRDMARKDGLADGGLEVLKSNIIGTGIKPQFNTPDAELNKLLAERWLEWTDQADADNRFDFYGLQALAVRSMLEAGDVFTRLRTRRPEDGLRVPLQLQLLESEFCPAEKIELRAGGTLIQNGVEFDAIGRRTAYWLYREHPNDATLRNFGTGMPVRVPASEVVHLAQVKRPGMVRGEPWLVRAIIKLRELDQYDDAQLVRQKLAAMFAGFMTPSADGVVPGMEEADENGVSLAPLEPGSFQVLPPGSSMTFTSPPSMGADYQLFMREQHRRVAGSLGVLYEQLTGDFSQVNDRTWRAAMNEFRRRLEAWQHGIVVFQWCGPILQRWAEYAVLNGAIVLPRGIEISQVARPKWIPQAHAYINPVQDVQARREEVRAGFRSRSEVVSERGYDAEAVDAEVAADNKRADDLGLTYDSDGRTDMKGAVPADEEPVPVPKETDAPPLAKAFEGFARAAELQAEAAKLQAGKPPVNVHLPEIKVNMPEAPAPVITVHVPEAKAPIVHVAAPIVHVAAPIVNLPVTKGKKIETTVQEHDAKGRIKKFVQEEL